MTTTPLHSDSPAGTGSGPPVGDVPRTGGRVAARLAQTLARVAALVGVFVVFTLIVGRPFTSAGNIENICMQSAVYAMAGLGMTMVIITGGIDLAAGSTIALAMVVVALMLSPWASNGRVPADAARGDETRITAAVKEAFAIDGPATKVTKSGSGGQSKLEFEVPTKSWQAIVETRDDPYGPARAGDVRLLVTRHYPLWTIVAVLAGVGTAAGVGLVQGTLITRLRVVPFVVTLGGLQTIRGIAKGVAGNQEISPPPSNGWLYQNLMYPVQGRSFSWQLVPLGVWATLAAGVVAAAMLQYTRLGRRIYAVGSSEATARLCGVPVARTKVAVYTIAGLFAGLAGVLEFSKLNMGQPTGAQSYELYVIAACVIGGTSLSGGVGSISGTIIGALMIGVLNAGAQQAGWEKWIQEVTIGLIVVAAVALDGLRKRSGLA